MEIPPPSHDRGHRERAQFRDVHDVHGDPARDTERVHPALDARVVRGGDAQRRAGEVGGSKGAFPALDARPPLEPCPDPGRNDKDAPARPDEGRGLPRRDCPPAYDEAAPPLEPQDDGQAGHGGAFR